MMKFARIFADERGESHFSDCQIPLTLTVVAERVPPIRASPRIATTHAQFLVASPSSVTKDWHPAPARQFAMFLKGSLAAEVSDGEVRRFGPGSFLFLEDTWGKGHKNHVVDDEEIILVFLPVPDDVALSDAD